MGHMHFFMKGAYLTWQLKKLTSIRIVHSFTWPLHTRRDDYKRPKKPFPPKPKLPRKPCWNPAIIKPNPNPILPQCHKIFTPGPNLPKKRPYPTHSDIKRAPPNIYSWSKFAKKSPTPPIRILIEHPRAKTNSKFNLRPFAILLQLLPKLPLPFSKELFRRLPLPSLCSWTSLSTSFSITSPPILKEGTVLTSFQLKLLSISPPRSWRHRQSVVIITTPPPILPNLKSLCQELGNLSNRKLSNWELEQLRIWATANLSN